MALAIGISSSLAAYRVNAAVKQAEAAFGQTDRAARALADYVEFQTRQLRDPRNQKAIEASLATPAIYNATGRLINTQLIPEAKATLKDLNKSVKSLNHLVERTDAQVNEQLLPAATLALNETAIAVKAYGLTAEKTSQAIEQLAKEGTITAQEARAFLQSPEWKAIWKNLETVTTETAETAANANTVTANLAEASKQAPGIAEDFRKFTQTTSGFRKFILAAMIVAAIGPFIR
jgi:hypothetical protein